MIRTNKKLSNIVSYSEEKYRMRVFENGVLRRKSGAKRNKQEGNRGTSLIRRVIIHEFDLILFTHSLMELSPS
jgi:hypothetical protein